MRTDQNLPGFRHIEQLPTRRVFNVLTAFETVEDGLAQDHLFELEEGRSGICTYFDWDSGRREVRAERFGDLELGAPRYWKPLCMVVDTVRFKDTYFDRAPVELLVQPVERNGSAYLRDRPERSGSVSEGPDVFSLLGELGVQHWVKAHQLPDFSGKGFTNRLYALFEKRDREAPVMLFAITRFNPNALERCPWPNEQFDLFG